jgi:uncharacterized protein (DUF302 family)
MTPDGLTISSSNYGPKETMDRLVAAVGRHGMVVMARIDHTAAGARIGLTLRPTEVLIFGNPRRGTPLMQALPTIAIDLPLKILVWQDDEGKTWVAYNDPIWLVRRHGAPEDMTPETMLASLALLAKDAAG